MDRYVLDAHIAARAAVANLPAVVRVGPFDIKVERWQGTAAHASNRWGEFSSVEQLIRITDNPPTKFKAVDTFLHEVSHAIFWAYGVGDADDEERIVSTTATAWTAFYRDNPIILTWLAGTLRD